MKFTAAQGTLRNFSPFVLLLYENSMKNTKFLLTIKMDFFSEVQKKEHLFVSGAVDCIDVSQSTCRKSFSLKETRFILYE